MQLPIETGALPASGVSPVARPQTVESPVEPEFIRTTLSPYANKGCIYQKTALHTFHEDQVSHGTRATFSIPDSCYIDSTGHFNAVELNICSNQMYYVLWADIIRNRRIAEVSHWTESNFKERQLPGMLIVRLESDFRKPIDAADFTAEGHIERMRVIGKGSRQTLFLRTRATFTDKNSGLARAEIDFAVF
jgi:hypothetical protein